MSLIDDAKNQLGELFITGFSGLELGDDTSAFLSQAKIGGVILFAPNYESPAQVAELVNQVQECRGRDGLPLWVCVDQEGGKVQRFKKPFTIIPPAANIGATDSPKLTFDLSEMMAKELKAVGINVNFCPVADILTNAKNPVIGNRAYGSDEESVSKHVTAMVRGHMVAGVQPCVKHFPGHGDTALDSHLALPMVETSEEVLKDREMRPFAKAFKSRCQMVMTAHILCKALDDKYPATLSRKIIGEILRKEMRYNRLVISDDLEMKAITDHYGAEEAPALALEAGCDLLIYRTEAGARKAYEALSKRLESGKLAPSVVLEAAARSYETKREFLMPYAPADVTAAAGAVGLPAHQAIVDRVKKL